MLRRVLALTVTLGVLASSPANAKPPGLPLDIHDGLQPIVAPWQQWNDQLMPLLAAALPPTEAMATPAPTVTPPHLPMPTGLSRLPVSARKQVVGCLLFGIHPLMSLTPLSEVLDQPCDHPTVKPAEQPEPMLVERIGIDFTPLGVIRIQRFEMEVCCRPLLVVQMPDCDLTGTVLGNLTRLLEADDLFAQGEKHLTAGQLAEALDCFTRAAECCPGSQSAHLAQAAVYRVFARIYRTGTGTTEEAETKPAEKPLSKKEARQKKKADKVDKKKKKKQPIAQIESQTVPMPTPMPTVVNGIALKPALPPVTPSSVQGLDRLEVPTPTLQLRIEEQAFAPDNAGSAEEAEEPWWFLPWYEEWTAPSKSA